MRVAFALFLSFFLLSTASFSKQVSSYDFPYKDGVLSSALAAITKPESTLNVEMLSIEPKPERANIPGFKNKNKYGFALLKQNQSAPLVFVLPGLGGTANDLNTLALAEQLYSQGFHVITLTSTFNWHFVIGVSNNGLVGFVPWDAEDLYSAMITIVQKVKRERDLKISNYSFIGYSLGAWVAAYVAKLDETQRQFNFKRVVLINSPIDIKYGVKTLDSFYNLANHLSQSDKNAIVGAAINVVSKLIDRPMNQNYYYGLEDSFNKFSTGHILFVIGDLFRSALADIINVSQKLADLSVLNIKNTLSDSEAQRDALKEISFMSYINQIIRPEVMRAKNLKSLSLDQLFAMGDLKNLQSFLSQNKNIYFIHNANDFLIRELDLEFAQSTFGSRFTLYPYGGHMGNTWFPENRTQLRQIMTF